METQKTLDPKRRAVMRELVKEMQRIITISNKYKRLQKKIPGYRSEIMEDALGIKDGMPPIPKELPEEFRAYL